MNFLHYQNESRKTAIYPNKGHNIIYPVLGLLGEAGEIAEIIKKSIRDRGGKLNAYDEEKLYFELGDVLWYLSNIVTELDLDLDEIAEANLDKLNSRKNRGKLQGSGDFR